MDKELSKRKHQARIDFTDKLEAMYRDEIMEKLFYTPGLAFRIMNNYPGYEKKEEQIMKVFYNEFKGELVRLERKEMGNDAKYRYNLSIYDREKKVTYFFENVKLSDVKFMKGTVSFE